MPQITITKKWILEKPGFSQVEIRALSNGTYQMLGHRSCRGDERWFDLNYSEYEIMEYVDLYGRDAWKDF